MKELSLKLLCRGVYQSSQRLQAETGGRRIKASLHYIVSAWLKTTKILNLGKQNTNWFCEEILLSAEII